MKVRIHHPRTHQPITSDLSACIQLAHRVDIAMAFMTRHGVDFLSKAIERSVPDTWRLVVSVRWPTDLEAIAELAERYPSSIWIHLGGLSPEERKAERYQLHSKIIKTEDGVGNVDLFIGSHNWTAMALEGVNIEVSAHIECSARDLPAIDGARHIEECVRESEQFIPERLDFYQAVQAKLHRNISRSASFDLAGFIADKRLIIHAEAEDEDIVNIRLLQLLFSPTGDGIEEVVVFEREVDLYVYPAGTLLGSYFPGAMPVRYSGHVTMINDSNDAAVENRQVNTHIVDLDAPIISHLRSINRGHISGIQVVARLERDRLKDMPVFHEGFRPKIHHQVDYASSSPPWMKELSAEVIIPYLTPQSIKDRELYLKTPAELIEEVGLEIPDRRPYRYDPFQKLQSKEDLNKVDERKEKRYVRRPRQRKPKPWETRYFYLVDYKEVEEEYYGSGG